MAEATVPVDLFNPGQIFACLGLVEAAEVLLGGGAGRFVWDGDAAEFILSTSGDSDPITEILTFLKDAEVVAFRPEGTEFDLQPDIPTRDYLGSQQGRGRVFPTSPQIEKARLITCLTDLSGKALQLDYWGERPGIDTAKFWAGNVTAPGLARLAIECLTKLDPETSDPFAFAAVQSSSFRFDWRRDYIPLDAGFSPNSHGHVVMVGYPVVELLAAIGLTHARPGRPDRTNKLLYHYGVLGGATPLPVSLLRAALTGGSASPVPGAPWRRFRMTLGWPGQEGQARCITDVQDISEEFLL